MTEGTQSYCKADNAGSYFEIFRSEIQLKNQEVKRGIRYDQSAFKGSEGAWSELEQIKEFDHRGTLPPRT